MKPLIVTLLIFFSLTAMFAQTEDVATSPKLKVDIGGALRFNYVLSSWKENQLQRGGDFGYDTFALKSDAVYGKLELHAELRFYSQDFGGTFFKYGWFQYNLNANSHLKVGLIPAYFGPQQFNSHSWFFQLPYYLGFEDDHDMGVSYSYNSDKVDLDLGFYKNAEELSFSDRGPVSGSRYGYDFSGNNKEVNQGNARFNYKWGKAAKHKVGTTLQYGGIYNIETDDIGSQRAIGLHYDGTVKHWNFQAQFIDYDNKPKNEQGASPDIIEVVAYNFAYNTAAKATIYSAGVAYTIPFEKGILKSLQLYNDYSYMDKAVSTFNDTQLNITGALFNFKYIYMYVDLIQGLNHPWLTNEFQDALSTGSPTSGWEQRLNINIGYYF